MDRTTQQVLGNITEYGTVIGREVILEYVNGRDLACDSEDMSSMVGTLERVTEESVEVSGLCGGSVPFAGHFAAICVIKQVGNNKPIYLNPIAHKEYVSMNGHLLPEEKMAKVRENGKWVY